MFLTRLKQLKIPDLNLILSVYISCALLFSAVLATTDPADFTRTFLHPLDKSYSILGTVSVFKDLIRTTRVYAFLPYWSVDKDMNLKKLTDLAYFGLNVDSKGRIVTTDGLYTKWRKSEDLTQALKKVKQTGGRGSLTLICHIDDDIEGVLGCKGCWEDLFTDLKKELIWAGIQDVNLDFEYSGYTTPKNARLYSDLAGYLNSRLDEAFGGDSFVAVSAYADSADRAERMNQVDSKNSDKDSKSEGEANVRLTDPKSLAQVADAIFIMAYDFHRPTSDNAGPVSPLEGSYTTTRLNLVKALESYLKVAPPEKLIIGLPFYGYDWVVEDTEPMSARIEGNDIIGFSKSRTYAEITDLLVKKQIKPLWDETSKTPYFNYIDDETGSKRQVWYDDAKSLAVKSALVGDNGLLGVGVWALGFEGGYSDIWKFVKSD